MTPKKAKPNGLDRAHLLRLLDAIEDKCRALRAQCADSAAHRRVAIETFRETFALKQRLRQADAYAREHGDLTEHVRPYANLAIREFRRNFTKR